MLLNYCRNAKKVPAKRNKIVTQEDIAKVEELTGKQIRHNAKMKKQTEDKKRRLLEENIRLEKTI